MGLLGDVGRVKFYFSPLEIVLVSVQDRCTVCAKMYHRLRNRFGCTRWYVKAIVQPNELHSL
jgi:hypothetical protein